MMNFVLLFFAVNVWALDQLEQDVTFLASDKLKGRVAGSAENKDVQNWLIERLSTKKVRPAGNSGQSEFRYLFKNSYDFKINQEISGTNIMGIIYPRNIWTDEKPKVMIGAHYDHTDICYKRLGPADDICNGAADNATSVAILLDLVEQLPNVIQAPVALAFWDAEEKGLLGSDAFLKSPSFEMNELIAYINLDIVGLNLYKGLEDHHFIIGSETGGNKMVDLVQSATEKSNAGVEYHQLSYAYGHGRSDMSSFVRHQYPVPVVFFTDGDGSIYHSNIDEVKYVNFKKVKSVSAVLKTMVQQLAKMNKRDFSYSPPTVFIDKGTMVQNILSFILGKKNIFKSGIPMPLFFDIPVIDKLYDRLLANKEANQLNADTIASLTESQMKIKEMKSKGEKSFGTVENTIY